MFNFNKWVSCKTILFTDYFYLIPHSLNFYLSIPIWDWIQSDPDLKIFLCLKKSIMNVKDELIVKSGFFKILSSFVELNGQNSFLI